MKSDLISPKVAWILTVLGVALTILFVRNGFMESSTSPAMDMTGGRFDDLLYGIFMMIIAGTSVMCCVMARRELGRMKALGYQVDDQAVVRKSTAITLVINALLGFFALVVLVDACG